MLTSLIIGDTHFKNSNINETTQMSEQIIQLAKKYKPNFIVILGDILDRHDIIDMIPLKISIEFFNQLKNISPIYILIGNHDRKNNKVFLTEEHPFTSLKYWNNTYVIDKVQMINIENFKFTMVPYVPPGQFIEALNTIDNWKESTCIFCHQEFKGCNLGYIISQNGDEWDNNYPYVISGHIHDYQKLQNNILYIGTPIQHDFFSSEKKIIGLITFNDKNLSHHNLQMKKLKLNMILKKNIQIHASQINSYQLKDDILAKIKIIGTEEEIKNIKKHPKIELWKNKNAKISFKYTIKENLNLDINIHEKFTTLLYQNICHNTELLLLYNEIFNN